MAQTVSNFIVSLLFLIVFNAPESALSASLPQSTQKVLKELNLDSSVLGDMDGAPMGFTCPEPAPVSAEDIMILKRSQNINAARLFINWLLSKEGQLAASYARRTTPIREDLQFKEIIPFADNVLGKEVSFRSPELEREVMPTLSKFWDKLWLSGGKRR